jgi:hypothetical protein
MALPKVASSNLSVLDDSSFPLFDWLSQTINASRAVSINDDLLWNAYQSDSDKSFIEKIREKSLRSAITNNPRDMLSEMKDSTLVIYRENDAWSVFINADLSVMISKSSLIVDVVDAPVVDVVDAPVVDVPTPIVDVVDVVDAPVVDVPTPIVDVVDVVDAPVVDVPTPIVDVVDAPIVDVPAPVVDVVDVPAPVVNIDAVLDAAVSARVSIDK